MPGVVHAGQPPHGQVGLLARLERADLVLAGRGSGRRPGWRATARRGRWPSAAPSSAGPGTRPGAARCPSPPSSLDAAPSTPSPTGAPACTQVLHRGRCRRRGGSWRSGSARRRCRSRRAGRPRRRRSGCRARTTRHRRASRAGRLARPGCSRTRRGTGCSSSRVSARWVCSRTPLSRASSAALRIRSSLTENGEHGPDRDPHERARRRVVEPVDRRRGAGERAVQGLDDRVRRQAAVGLAAVHRPAHAVQPDADRARRPPRSRRTRHRRRAGRRSGGRRRWCSRSARAG